MVRLGRAEAARLRVQASPHTVFRSVPMESTAMRKQSPIASVKEPGGTMPYPLR
jgi:hypothetical protein